MMIRIFLFLILTSIFSFNIDFANYERLVLKPVDLDLQASPVDCKLNGQEVQNFELSINKMINQRKYRHTSLSIAVQRLDGTPVYSYGAGQKMIPASTIKLITTAVALEILGPGYTFKTTLATDGIIKDGMLLGNLILQGGADPKLSGFFDASIADVVKEWVDSLQIFGIEKITGGIYLDNSFYMDAHGEIQRRYLTTACFDQATRQQLTQWVPLDNGNFIKKRIRLPRRSTRKMVDVHLNNYLGNLLVNELTSRKMTNQKFIQSELDSLVASELQEILVHESELLYKVLERTNKKSDNFYASQILRTLGWECCGGATQENGRIVIKRYLQEKMAIDSTVYQIADGSGLSYENSISANVLNQVLTFMQNNSPYWIYYYESLSIPKVDGTLISRINHPLATNVHAKTGTLSSVISLSGYLTTSSGEPLVFSMIANGGSKKLNRILLDHICVKLLEL